MKTIKALLNRINPLERMALRFGLYLAGFTAVDRLLEAALSSSLASIAGLPMFWTTAVLLSAMACADVCFAAEG